VIELVILAVPLAFSYIRSADSILLRTGAAVISLGGGFSSSAALIFMQNVNQNKPNRSVEVLFRQFAVFITEKFFRQVMPDNF
jgi:hypothetical protein